MGDQNVSLYVGKTFQSWEEALTAVNAYADQKYFEWSTDTSVTIKSENRTLMAREDRHLYKTELKYKNIKLVCLCGGKKRIGSGRGERAFQSTWKTGCPVKIHLIANAINRTMLDVTEFHEEHNHTLSKEMYDVLPKARKKSLHKAGDTVKTLIDAGVKPTVIRGVLRSMGCGAVHLRDLSNLRAKWKREKRDGKSDEERLVDRLERLLEMDPGACVHIGKTEDENLEFLFIQTSAMRRCDEKFGKVLLLDHTYKINKNRMPVTVMMVMDGHGSGRVAGYAFVANEQSTTIKLVLEAFKTSITDEVANNIKTVIVDKDYSEVKAIRDVFPHASIQLCDFHVSRTFINKTNHEDKQVRGILTELRFCLDSDGFSSLVGKLKNVATSTFFKYFEDNWLNSPMAWSFRDKKKSANMGNTTNNIVEVHNSKIKVVLNADKALDEAIDGLLELLQNKEDDVLFRNTLECVKEAYITTNNNPIAHEIVNDLTRFCAKLLLWELSQKVSDSEISTFKSDENTCTCPHFWSYHLPCRHMMHCRRKSGRKIYDRNEIDSMWYQVETQDSPEISTVSSRGMVAEKVVPSKFNPKVDNRDCHAANKGKVLVAVMTVCSDEEYIERCKVLDQLVELWKLNKRVAVLEKVREIRDLLTNNSAGSRFGSTLNPVVIDLEPDQILELPDDLRQPETDATQPQESNHLTEDQSPLQNATTRLQDDTHLTENGAARSEDLDKSQGEHHSNVLKNTVSTTDLVKLEECQPVIEDGFGTLANPIFIDLSSEDEGDVPNVDSNKDSTIQENHNAGHTGTSSTHSTGLMNRNAMTPGSSATFSGTVSLGNGINNVVTPGPTVNSIEAGSNTSNKTSNEELPFCFCKIRVLRLIAGPNSKMRGRAFFRCAKSTKPCDFFRIAPTKNIKARRVEENVNADKNATKNHDSNVTSKPTVQSTSKDAYELFAEDDEGDRNLAALLLAFEEEDTANKSLTSNPTEQVPDDTLKSIKEIMKDVKIPTSVKHKGRPRNIHKTVVLRHPKGNKADSKKDSSCGRIKRPQGAFRNTNLTQSDSAENRKKMGADIPDGHVVKKPDFWLVRSQSRDKQFTVQKISDSSNCSCSQSKKCEHCFSCTCEDYLFRGLPCKHIYKVVDMFFSGKDIPTSSRIITSRASFGDTSAVSGPSSIDRCQTDNVPGCIACLNGDLPSGAHVCQMCFKEVHTLPGCSIPVDADAEGYGQGRICMDCNKGSSNSCAVCKKLLDTNFAICTVCSRKAHTDTLCSLPDISHMQNGVADEAQRVCRLCICPTCKLPMLHQPHFCLCTVCKKSTTEKRVCSNCCEPFHVECGFNSAGNLLLCNNCTTTQSLGLTANDVQLLSSTEMLSDTLIVRASEMLKNQFPHIMGLAPPIAAEQYLVRAPAFGQEHHTYVPCKKKFDYIQIINTGKEHWLTCYKQRGGENEIHVLDSMGCTNVGSFVEQQLALILNTDSPIFFIAHRKVKLQADWVNQCGPMAVAYATELAFTGEVKYVDFHMHELRPHLFKCIVQKKLEPFPRARVEVSKRLRTEEVKVICSCRLPRHYDPNIIKCNRCREWCHFKCHDLTTEPATRRWICNACVEYHSQMQKQFSVTVKQ